MSFGDISWPASGKDETGWRFEILSLELLEQEPKLPTEPPVD